MREGSCLCGAVRVRAALDGDGMGACHCTQCQRWTGGGPYLHVDVAEMRIDGKEAVRIYRASDWGERAFCGVCGSTLWWRMQGKPIASIAAGLLDDQSALTVGTEIFVDTRPGWLPPFEGASQSTEAEEQAKLAAFLEKEGSA